MGRSVVFHDRRYRQGQRMLDRLEPRVLLSAGDLDPSFGNAGREIFATSDTIVAMAVQQNGDIILLGSNSDLYRYLPNGSPDLSFGSGGKTGPVLQGGPPDILLIQPDQNILVIGGNGTSWPMARLTPNGQLDPLFGSGGTSSVSVKTSSRPASAAVGNGGQIVIGTNSGFLVGLSSNGAFDGSFGQGGIVTNFGAGTVADGPNGTYLLEGGNVVREIASSGSVVQFGNSGDGSVTLSGLPNTVGSAPQGTIDVLPNGQILLSQPVLTRLNADGSLDTAFGAGGKVARSGAMAVQSDGKILLGWTDQKTWAGSQFAIARLNPDGSLDTSFGDNGTTEDSPFSNSQGTLLNLGVGPGDHTVAMGASIGLTPAQFGAIALSPTGEHFTQFDYEADGSLLFTGTRQSENIIVSPSSDGSGVFVTDGTAVSFEESGITALRINALQGNDAITINAGITIPLIIDGGDGADSIVFAGTAGDDNFTADASTVTGSFGNVTATNFESRIFNSNGGNDTVNVSGGVFTFNGGSGNSAVTLSGNIAATVNGGTDNDSLTVQASSTQTPANITFDGGAGVNSLTVNGAATSNAFTDAVPNSNGLSSVLDGGLTLLYKNVPLVNLNGGPAADTFVLKNASVAYIVNGEAGDDTFTDQGVVATLLGGDGNDTFIARDGVNQTIDGGPGNDIALVDAGDSVTNVEGVTGGHLHGTVYVDANQNGMLDPGEVGPNGGDGPTAVFIDLNGNGVLDQGEPQASLNGDGTYSFDSADFYTLAGKQISIGLSSHAYTVTAPASGFLTLPAPAAVDTTGVNLGVRLNPATISGGVLLSPGKLEAYTIYDDVNNNDMLDPGESSAQTNSLGQFTLSVLATGNQNIRIVVPSGYSAPSGDLKTQSIGYGGTYSIGNFVLQSQPIIVEGTLFNDLNDNGVQDSGESSLSGFQVFSDLNNDGIYFPLDDQFAVTTDSTGHYKITINSAGTVGFSMTPTAGWSATPQTLHVSYGQHLTGINIAARQTGPIATIQGTVYQDANANGSFGSGDTPEYNAWVYLDNNNDGRWDRGDQYVTTDINGHYSINVTPGQQAVVGLVGGPPSGTYFESPASGFYTVMPSAGQTITGQDFAAAPDSSVTGSLFNDLNGDDSWDNGESLLSGWQVQIYKDNGSSGPPTLLTATVSTNGSFAANFVPSTFGPLIVVPVAPSGWVESFPTNLDLFVGSPNHQLNVGSLGFTQLGAINGTVFDDANGNGIFDSGDTALSGYIVFADLNNNGVLDAGEPSSRIVDTRYSLGGLLPGSYTIRQVAPPGYISKNPSSGAVSVTVSNPQRIDNVNFIDVNPNTLSGTVYYDANDNLTRDAGEIGAAGVTVFLDANGNGRLDAGERSRVSNSSGAYTFSAVAVGTYTVVIQVPVNWQGENNPIRQYTIGTDVQISGVDFGVRQLPVANLGGPYSVPEGGQITLDGSASSEVGGNIVSCDWQSTYDSQLYSLGSGRTVIFRANLGQDGPGTQQIQLTVTDAAGVSSTVTGSVSFTNTPPTATFSSGGSVTQGSDGSVMFTHSYDPSVWDQENLVYSYDFNNDGTFEITNSSLVQVDIPASYLSTVGSHTIRGRVSDKDGGFNDYTTTIQVTAASTGTITGTIYNDANGNGVKDTGEVGVSGQKMFLDLNRNAVLDSGEPTFTTGSNGVLTFSGLAAGTYRVRMTQLTGWTWTAPTSGYYEVAVAAGQTATTKDYLEKKTSLNASAALAVANATISGTVFKDTNGDGIQNNGESGLAGSVVFLDTNNDGKLDDGEVSFITGSAGKYSFVVKPGRYNVRLLARRGFTRTTPSSGAYAITLANGATAGGRSFGER